MRLHATYRGSGHGRRVRPRRRRRTGGAAVEFAIVAVPLILLLLTVVEFGRALMCVHSLEEAARLGCRTAVLQGTTVSEVETTVAETLAPAGIGNQTVAVSPNPLGAAAAWSPVTVTVTASYADLSWLPVPAYFGSANMTASCTLPREGQGSS